MARSVLDDVELENPRPTAQNLYNAFSTLFLGLTRLAVGAVAAQMSRLQAALYFFCFPLAAPRVARVLASPRRVRNRRGGLVGFGFERSLVSAVTCFWPDSGYYSTPSRPQRYKLIKLVAAGE